MSKMSEIHAFIEDRLYKTGDYDRIAEELASEYSLPHAYALQSVYNIAKYMDEQAHQGAWWVGDYDDDYLDSATHTEYLK